MYESCVHKKYNVLMIATIRVASSQARNKACYFQQFCMNCHLNETINHTITQPSDRIKFVRHLTEFIS